ncbi:MAG: hypothetical protein LC734_03575 [Acidobacteria bacterium]|nr:hypothetical protein [Acidobacteriota bacterium]
MLIDEFLSEYDFVERHDISIRAEAADIYRAANETDFSDSFIIALLMRLRGMSGGKITLRNLKKYQFEMLGETANKEMVIGLIGRFWTIGGGLQKIDADSFKRFETAGYAKAVWNFSLAEDGADTRLSTETRIKCTDADSKRRFGFYWTFIQPFSGLIRMETLRLIKNKAEAI